MREKKPSVDASYLRKFNKRLVLDTIYARETTSRAELSKLLRLSKPAIADSVAELLTLGIVAEIGEGAAAEKGGRRPVLLRFQPNYRYILALDLNYSNPVVVLGNLKNEIFGETEIQMPQDVSPGRSAAIISGGIDRLLHASGCKLEDIYCAAISSPGVFDAEGNLLSQNPGYGRILWNESHLLEALKTRYGMKVIVKNDIKAATLGEWAYGAGRGEQNLLYLSCGVGLGSGIMIHSALYEGRRFNAGEIYYYLDSHSLDGEETLENRLGMQRLIRSSMEDIQMGAETCMRDYNRPVDFSDITAAYQNGDPYIRRKVQEICDELCTLIFHLGNFLALDKVIFGGEYVVFGETLLAEYAKRYQPRIRNGAGIELAALGKYAGVHGMLFTAKESCFEEICRQGAAE